MKQTSWLLVAILSGCSQPATSGLDNNQKDIHPYCFLSLADAEKILGEPAHLTDSTWTQGDVSRYHCAYTANAKDGKSGKTGVIYFLFEQYPRVSSAQEKYSFIKQANENHGIKELHNIGDEAYFHTDGENFYFIMVRKGISVFNMKVNKITSTTSLDAFNVVAKNITEGL